MAKQKKFKVPKHFAWVVATVVFGFAGWWGYHKSHSPREVALSDRGNSALDFFFSAPFSVLEKNAGEVKSHRTPASGTLNQTPFEIRRADFVHSEQTNRSAMLKKSSGKNFSVEQANAPVPDYVSFVADAKRSNAAHGLNKKLLALSSTADHPKSVQQKMVPRSYMSNPNAFDEPGKKAQTNIAKRMAGAPHLLNIDTNIGPSQPKVGGAVNKKYYATPINEAQAKDQMQNDHKMGSTFVSAKAKAIKAKAAGQKSISYSDDYYEPNDYQSSAYSLVGNEDYWLPHGNGYQCDDDWYKIYVSPSYRNLTLDLRFSNYEGDIDMRLYDEIGNNIASSTSSSDDEYINITLSNSGYYYVKVYYGDHCNSYDFKWSTAYTGVQDDYYEDNDSPSSAYNLDSYENTWLSSIHGDGVAADDDYYAVYVTQGAQRLVVDLRYTYSYGDIDLKVYGPCTSTYASSCYSSYSQVASSTSSNDDEYIDVSGLTPGWYFIRVYPYSSSTAANTYDMKWYLVNTGPTLSEDNYEPNDYRSTSDPEITNNSTIDANQFDEDWFKFRVADNATRKVRFNLTYKYGHQYGDIDMRIIDQNGFLIASSETNSSSGEYIETTIPDATEWYYVQIFGDNQGNEYYLNYQNLNSGPSEDNYEPNNSQSSAYDLTNNEGSFLSNIRGTGTLKNDDWYKIQVVGGYRHLVVDLRFAYLNEGGGVQDIDMELHDSTGALVVASRNAGNDELIDTVVPSEGVYYIKLTKGVGATSFPGNTYDMKWSTSADGSALTDAHTGGWYNPAINRQGFFFEFVKRTDAPRSTGVNQFISGYFTYDPTDTNNPQRPHWLYLTGYASGNKANMQVVLLHGGKYGNGTPAPTNEVVGSATLTMSSCGAGNMALHLDHYPGMAVYDAVIPLSKLAPFMEVGGIESCTGVTRTATAVSNRGIQRGHMGQWYNPDNNGQGFFLDFVTDPSGTQRMVGAYYTYSPLARSNFPPNPVSATDWKYWWYLDVEGTIQAGTDKINMNILVPKQGKEGRFNAATNPDPEFILIGKAELSFASCTQGHFRIIQVNPGMEQYLPSPDSVNPNAAQLDVPLTKIAPVPTYNGQPLCHNW